MYNQIKKKNQIVHAKDFFPEYLFKNFSQLIRQRKTRTRLSNGTAFRMKKNLFIKVGS